MSGFNFNSAPKRNNPSALDWAVIGGLVQQRQQINLQKDSLNIQSAMLQQQALAAELASAQLTHLQQVEAERQREKIEEVWKEEFKHQGMSPLEAHIQVNAENEIQQLISETSLVGQNLEADTAGTERVIRLEHKILTERSSGRIAGSAGGVIASVLMLLDGFRNTSLISVITIAGFLGFLLSFYGIYRYYKEWKNNKENIRIALIPENLQEEVYLRNREARWRFFQSMISIKNQLDAIPASRLFDDSDFRQIVTEAVHNGEEEFANS